MGEGEDVYVCARACVYACMHKIHMINLSNVGHIFETSHNMEDTQIKVIQCMK